MPARSRLTDRSVGTLGDPVALRNTEKAAGSEYARGHHRGSSAHSRPLPDRMGSRPRRLTREVEISKATLFHHFRSIDEIPLLALEHLALQLQAFAPPEKAVLGDAIEALGVGTRTLIEQQRDFH